MRCYGATWDQKPILTNIHAEATVHAEGMVHAEVTVHADGTKDCAACFALTSDCTATNVSACQGQGYTRSLHTAQIQQIEDGKTGRCQTLRRQECVCDARGGDPRA